MSSILISNISKVYQNGDVHQTVLKNISFKILPGQSIALLGASGSGKSTLLHIISGLLKPDSGLIKFEDESPINLQTLGMIFQSHHLIMELSVLENVLLPLQIQNSNESLKHAQSALHAVGLSDFKEHYPNMLSGGQKQRVAIARAIVTQPKIIIADEPTGSLDHDNAQNVMRLLFELKDQFKTSLVIATHDLDFAKRCDVVFNIKNGDLKIVL